ncbi:uncharacterized protein [Montipora foliosa]|uniref:uncharacterized protein n=1 Tax=Montipora foliosa TaxID=591990 RepID=UPI0035F195B7
MAFATHGLPEMVVTDNGSNFVSSEFENFLKMNPAYPNSSIPSCLEWTCRKHRPNLSRRHEENQRGKCGNQSIKITESIPYHPSNINGSFACRTLVGKETEVAKLDLVYTEMGRKVRVSQCVLKEKHDLHVKKRIVKERDEVWARNVCQGPKWMPGIVQQSNGPISFEVELEDGRKWRRHQDHLIQRASDPQM